MELLFKISNNRLVYWANITFFLILFLSIMVMQTRQGMQDISGIIAQIQVLVSVYLCVAAARTGYILAVVMNGMVSLLAVQKVLLDRLVYATPGIVIPLNTIVLVTVIFVFMDRLNRKLLESRKQNEDMVALNLSLIHI